MRQSLCSSGDTRIQHRSLRRTLSGIGGLADQGQLNVCSALDLTASTDGGANLHSSEFEQR